MISTFDFRRIGTLTTGLSPLFRRIDYNDLSRVNSVLTIDLSGMPMKFVSHVDVPDGEIHILNQDGTVQISKINAK